MGGDSTAYFSLIVVLVSTIIALITDLKDRMIYKQLTVPVLVGGLFYTLYNLSPYFKNVTISKSGITVLWYILQAWLGPVLFIFTYSLLLFWLGILDGGDGHFLIAMTPWLGGERMIKVILYFYPVALVYLIMYLLYHYKFSISDLIRDQIKDTATLMRRVPKVYHNLRNQEPYALSTGISYETTTRVKVPAGMVPISIAVLGSLII